MSESNNNVPMRITQLEEATAYEDGMYYAVAKAGSGTKKIAADVLNFVEQDISENINNLYEVDDVVIGKDWAGSVNSKRAVIYIAVNPSTNYTVFNPSNDNISYISVIEKNQNTGASGSLATHLIGENVKSTFTTTENTNYLCIQFNGTNDISTSDFENYDLFVCEGLRKRYTAVDEVARNSVLPLVNDVQKLKVFNEEHTEIIGNIVDFANLQIGKDWTGGTNSKRAVLYIAVDSNTDYFIDVPDSQKITYISVIEKAGNAGAAPAIVTTNIGANESKVITTSSTTKYFCIQFVSSSDLSLGDFSDYDLYITNGDKPQTTCIDSVARSLSGFADFDTFTELAENKTKGISRVGGYFLRNMVQSPTLKTETQDAHNTPYYDVNSTIKQYETTNYHRPIPYKHILNNLEQEEIDFTPNDDGFTRIICGKNDDDLFFVNYVASNRVGTFGDPKYDALEVTSDFVNFTTILRSDLLETGDGIRLTDMTNIKIPLVKQFADGSYIVAVRAHSISGNNDYTHFYKLSKDFQTITHMNYVNFSGVTVPMTDEFNTDVYDWSVFVTGEKAIATTYGNRNPLSDFGRVWYTEDNGNNWKQVFQTNNHLNDGQPEGKTVTEAHTHGVMIDKYSGRLFVIVGENNKNVFWSDKGINTTDNDWNILEFAKKGVYNFQTDIQTVNGFAFPDSLVFGSDNGGVGCIYRVNKLDNGGYSDAESAFEFLPNKWDGVYYCAADLSQRDDNSPLLMCETHESARFTEENNELLNLYHKARVVATFDGINFTEIWEDDTYGAHNVYIDGEIVSRNFSWCMRGMNAWLLKNGDVIIKYVGRDYYYFGGEPMFSAQGISNGCCKIRLIKNAEKYLS